MKQSSGRDDVAYAEVVKMKFVLKFKNAKGEMRYAKGHAMLIRFLQIGRAHV